MPDQPASASVEVEVAYAERDRQVLRVLRLPAGSTVAQAIEAARLHDSIPAEPAGIGIFGRLVQPGEILNDGDRVELYRPLLRDPKEARRRRATTGSKI